jgi:choline transport protein
MEKGIDLQTMGEDAIRNRARGSMSEAKGQEWDQDRYELARVGKKEVLKVGAA